MAVVVLLGPTALAFFAGGYFDEPRLFAGIAAWALVAAAAIASRSPLPSSTEGRVALGGLALLTAWVGVSSSWAPLSDPAFDDVERLLLYTGGLAAAAAWLRGSAEEWVEPVLAGGALVVVGYGLSGRMLPGLIDMTNSASAAGRLEQPLTYWNGMGALAAIGLVLLARVAGTAGRPARLRLAAAAAAPVLVLGVYLSFSRGAIAMVGIGLAVLLALAPDRAQLRAVAITLAPGALLALAMQALPGVRSLEGSASDRELEGAIALALLAVAAAGGALLARLVLRRERDGRAKAGPLPLARHSATVAVALALMVVGAVAGAAALERAPKNPVTGATPARLASTESNRYAYWRVAVGDFADHPVAGSGSGGFRVAWLRERDEFEPARDAHSLYLETAGELGLVGLLLLALFLGGVAAGARRAYRVAPAAAAGPAAACAAWAVHAGLDWAWELPGVTLPALALAGALIALADRAPAD